MRAKPYRRREVAPETEWFLLLRKGFTDGLFLFLRPSRILRAGAGSLFFFEDFLGEDWKFALRRVAEFLGPSYVEKLPEYEKEAGAFIRRDLQHHKASIRDMLDRADIPMLSNIIFYFV